MKIHWTSSPFVSVVGPVLNSLTPLLPSNSCRSRLTVLTISQWNNRKTGRQYRAMSALGHSGHLRRNKSVRFAFECGHLYPLLECPRRSKTVWYFATAGTQLQPLALASLRRVESVRFGSKADMCSATAHVRFTPESGHCWHATRSHRRHEEARKVGG